MFSTSPKAQLMPRHGALPILFVTFALVAGCAGQPSASSAPTGSAVVTASPEPSPTASPSPTPEPTPDPPAELVLRISHTSFADHWRSTSLVDDGRLTTPSDNGWLVRILSPSGVERVRNEVLDTGLFSESSDLPLEPMSDAPECFDGIGLVFGATIEVVAGGSPVAVSWERTNVPEGCYVPSAERDTLDALLERLTSLGSWLPADAWQEQARRPLEVETFRLITVSQPRRSDLGALSDIATVDWPLNEGLPTFGEEIPFQIDPRWDVRCGVVTSQEREIAADALTDAGADMADSSPPGFASLALFEDPEHDATVAVILEALPPDRDSCEDVDLGFLNCWTVGPAPIFYCAIH